MLSSHSSKKTAMTWCWLGVLYFILCTFKPILESRDYYTLVFCVVVIRAVTYLETYFHYVLEPVPVEEEDET